MVWMGDDIQTCYPMDVIVFSGTVNGKNRLIWTCLEDKQSKQTYSLIEPFSATELCVYDLFNREYLFTLSFPQNSLQSSAWDLFNFITDLSPALSNAVFDSSMDLFNLEALYQIAGIDTAEIENVGIIYNYIYVETNSIGPWDKSKAIEAYCAVTPDEYVLPYWEYVPNTIMPENFYSNDTSVSTSIPTVEYTQEQKELLLGSKPNSVDLATGHLTAFFCKVNGQKRIIWTVDYSNAKESDEEFEVMDIHSVFNNEYLFSLRLPASVLSEGMLVNEEWKYYFKSTTQLEGIKLLGSSSLSELSKAYSDWGIVYSDEVSFTDIPSSADDVARHYLNLVPDQYLMPFWEYVPNAVTPDGFVTPAPEGSQTTTP